MPTPQRKTSRELLEDIRDGLARDASIPGTTEAIIELAKTDPKRFNDLIDQGLIDTKDVKRADGDEYAKEPARFERHDGDGGVF